MVAVPAIFLGLHLSTVTQIEEAGFFLGESLLLKAATLIMFPNLGPGQDVLLHPVGFAGWIGLLVTMLNLLPLAQLDGGHIAYALLGERQEWLGKAIFVALIPMGILLSPNWLFWGLLILILMRTVKHPPVADIQRPLTPHEIRIGLACIVIFILCFIPVPFKTL
jgi:membrane-associated protease RseP (regulator of RpoE activity)